MQLIFLKIVTALRDIPKAFNAFKINFVRKYFNTFVNSKEI